MMNSSSDTPTFISRRGNKHWKNAQGRYHREDGPAKEYVDGRKEWWINGVRHRDDGPAIEWADGDKFWFRNGQLHRDDGPAIECVSGTKHWYNNGLLHRDDGPAIEYYNGSKLWYINNQRHREDGPAIIHPEGLKEYYINNQRHREDGPAIERGEYKEWYLKGIHLSSAENALIINNKISIDLINKELNIEKRRLYQEYFGIEKYVLETKGKITLSDQYGTLYRIENFDVEPIVMVKVKNSTPEPDGSYKFYFIRVPPNMKTPKEAIAWTFGLAKHEYRPNIET